MKFTEIDGGKLRCDLKVWGDKDISLKGFNCDLKDPSLARGARIEGDKVTGTKCGDDRDGDFARGRHHHRDRDDHDRADRDCDRDGDRHHDRDRDDEDRSHDTDRDCGTRFEDHEGGCQEASFTISHDECALSVHDVCGEEFEIVTCGGDDEEETVLCGETPAADDSDLVEDVVIDEEEEEAEEEIVEEANEEDPLELPIVDMNEEELAAMNAADNAAEEADIPEFLI